MGHSIHKHMNSFKAKNLLSEMPIDNKASALEMDKGSAMEMNQAPTMKKGAMYMKDDMAPKMEEGSAAYMEDDTPLAKHTKAQAAKLNPGLVSAIHMHDDFTKKNNIKHK